MNKHGFTLIEIIVSVALISVVMLFLFQLLNDLTYSDAHASYSKENQVNRVKIIRAVEQDLMSQELINVGKSSNNGNLRITFTFMGSGTPYTTYLDVTQRSVSYNGETWIIDETMDPNTTYDIKIDDVMISKYPASSTSTEACTDTSCNMYQYVKVIVPVLSGTSDNRIDDLEFYYIGNK